MIASVASVCGNSSRAAANTACRVIAASTSASSGVRGEAGAATADAAITGIPNNQFVLNAGQVVEMYVGGNAQQPGDFEVEADKPIAVVNYMTGAQNAGAGIGDPAMVQLSPIEQFLPRYVVLVPGRWVTDVAVIARLAGAPITLDGAAIDDGLFVAVADSGFEVARVPVTRSQVVQWRTPLRTPLARFVLVNAISLMPGTLTARVDGNALDVHLFDADLPWRDDVAALEAHIIAALESSAGSKR